MIWPFKKTTTAEYKTPIYQGVKFGKLLYEPADDITPHEVSLLLPLFITMYGFDRQEYIKRHKLTRHFKEIEDASTSK